MFGTCGSFSYRYIDFQAVRDNWGTLRLEGIGGDWRSRNGSICPRIVCTARIKRTQDELWEMLMGWKKRRQQREFTKCGWISRRAGVHGIVAAGGIRNSQGKSKRMSISSAWWSYLKTGKWLLPQPQLLLVEVLFCFSLAKFWFYGSPWQEISVGILYKNRRLVHQWVPRGL